jgi:hypothetical protein
MARLKGLERALSLSGITVVTVRALYANPAFAGLTLAFGGFSFAEKAHGHGLRLTDCDDFYRIIMAMAHRKLPLVASPEALLSP